MNKILVTIPIIPETAIRAEKLLDWIAELNAKKRDGDVLLVFSVNVHPEQRLKIQIAAEVAFETVGVLNGTALPDAKLNSMFKLAAEFVLSSYRTPFLWLEPDCIPLKRGWMAELKSAYFNQPKRHMGGHLFSQGQEDKLYLGRIAVYSPDMAVDSGTFFNTEDAFEIQGGSVLLSRSHKSRLIQYLNYEGKSDFSKIRPDAIILCSDKEGHLTSALREQLQILTAEPITEDFMFKARPEFTEKNGNNVPVVIPKRRGRPRKQLLTV